MPKVKLPRGEWHYDPEARLGREGGFGAVYEGTAEGGEPVAVKRLKIDAHEVAHREMTIADELTGRALRHVMPVLDAGLDPESDSYFVVMPRAEKSLQAVLDKHGKFDDIEAARILLQILEGLSEVGDIVHRDLKPDNVLFHEGRWKVADFGIARFVEESTSPHTLKGCLTPAYAAPEQWRFEHATPATDTYALGCVGYALLTGRPPFPGPEAEDYRQQHLNDSPPPLEGHEARLRSMLSLMLGKAPEKRPSQGRVKEVMTEISERPTGQAFQDGAFEALARADAAVAERQGREEVEHEQTRSEEERRAQLAAEATQGLGETIERMIEYILAAAAATARRSGTAGVVLGRATLRTSVLNRGLAFPPDAFPLSKWDVIAGAIIRVHQPHPEYVWSASLWFTNRGGPLEYRWYEVSYFAGPFASVRPRFTPFALDDLKDADIAVAQTIGWCYVAEGPKPIDGEDERSFIQRWCERLAKAAEGRLGCPNRLPIV